MTVHPIATVAVSLGLAAVVVAAAGGQEGPRSVRQGVYTPDQAKRGQSLYGQQCSSCHGASLSGGDTATALAGREFLTSWNGSMVDELTERIRTSMPQNQPGILDRKQVTDIVAYILSANTFPAGNLELAPDREAQARIKIEADAP